MSTKKPESVDRNICPQCKQFLVFEKPKPGHALISMNEEIQIVCSCGFLISDMSDIHPKRPWLKGRKIGAQIEQKALPCIQEELT